MLIELVMTRPGTKRLAETLALLSRHDEDFLRAHPDTPELYRSGVYWSRETAGRERWLDIPQVLKAGWGDCEDLAAWLCAQYRVRGVAARTALRSGGRARLLHAVVLLPNGREEDPSRRLRR